MLLHLAFLPALAYAMTPIPPSSPLPAAIFAQFASYTFLYHLDASKSPQFDDIIANSPAQPQIIALYNTHPITVRPPVDNLLHIVLLDQIHQFAAYSQIEYNFFHTDCVLFIIDTLKPLNNSLTTKFWQMPGLEWSSGILIYELTAKQLHFTCFYCGNLTGVLQNIENITKAINRYGDFNGHVFRVAYSNFPPFFECVRIVNGSCACAQGAESSLLAALSKLLNFRYALVEYRSDFDVGPWEGMVEGVRLRKVDWALGGITASLKRGNITDFTRYIKQQGYSILFAVYEPKWLLLERFAVFEWPVWACLGASIAFIGLVAKMATRTSWMRFSLVAMRSIVEQSVTDAHFRVKSVRLVFAIWWLTIMCLNTMYKSALTSSLITPNFKEPMTVEELLNEGFQFYANKADWSVLKENLIFSSDPVFARLLERIEDNLEFCDTVAAALNGKFAVIEEESPIQYNVFKLCSKRIELKNRLRLRILPNKLFGNSYHAWSMQLGMPFRRRFSSTIGRLDDYGLLYHWYHEAFSYHLSRSNEFKSKSGFLRFPLGHFMPFLIVLCVGYLISVLVFLYEAYEINRIVMHQ